MNFLFYNFNEIITGSADVAAHLGLRVSRGQHRSPSSGACPGGKEPH